MTFHVLHLFEHGSYVYKKRGRLYCQFQGGRERSLPIENIKAVVVAARGITFSSALLSALATENCLVLHCNEKYQPIAVTMPLPRIINQRILFSQCANRGNFHTACWQKVLEAKIRNQSALLSVVSKAKNPIEEMIAAKNFDEALSARMYFSRYFNSMGAVSQNRANRGEGWLNALLNYGYAVLSALVHRSIVVHGLLPQMGIHHKPRYGTWPLVYDLMEPFRAIVDAHVWAFCSELQTIGEHAPMEHFSRFIGTALKDFRLPHKRYSIKLLDAIDFMVRSFATACEERNANLLLVPIISCEEYEAIQVGEHT